MEGLVEGMALRVDPNFRGDTQGPECSVEGEALFVGAAAVILAKEDYCGGISVCNVSSMGVPVEAEELLLVRDVSSSPPASMAAQSGMSDV